MKLRRDLGRQDEDCTSARDCGCRAGRLLVPLIPRATRNTTTRRFDRRILLDITMLLPRRIKRLNVVWASTLALACTLVGTTFVAPATATASGGGDGCQPGRSSDGVNYHVGEGAHSQPGDRRACQTV